MPCYRNSYRFLAKLVWKRMWKFTETLLFVYGKPYMSKLCLSYFYTKTGIKHFTMKFHQHSQMKNFQRHTQKYKIVYTEISKTHTEMKNGPLLLKWLSLIASQRLIRARGVIHFFQVGYIVFSCIVKFNTSQRRVGVRVMVFNVVSSNPAQSRCTRYNIML